LLACELAGSLNSILLCDINHTVYTSRIKYFWQIRFWPATYPRYRSFFGRLAPNDLNVRILLFQKHGAAHDSPRGPHGTQEMADCTNRLLPYIGCGSLDMRFVIIGLSQLTENKYPILLRLFFPIITADIHTFQQRNLNVKVLLQHHS